MCVLERARACVSASDSQSVKRPSRHHPLMKLIQGDVSHLKRRFSPPRYILIYRVAPHESRPLDTPAECATQPLAYDSFLLKDVGQLQCQALLPRRGRGEGIVARVFVLWAPFLSQRAAAQDSAGEVYTD